MFFSVFPVTPFCDVPGSKTESIYLVSSEQPVDQLYSGRNVGGHCFAHSNVLMWEFIATWLEKKHQTTQKSREFDVSFRVNAHLRTQNIRNN